MKAKVVLISNTAWYLYNFRRTLISRLLAEGHGVTAIAPHDEYAEGLREAGAVFLHLPMDNKGTNPIADLAFAIAIRRLLRQVGAGCVLTFTVKPNIFGTFAAASLGIPAVCNISGLGTVFIKQTWVTRVVLVLYRGALRLASRVFFQNPDDLGLFVGRRLVDPEKARLLPGSGVDTARFAPAESRAPDARFRFLLLGRLLWDKGIGEFVEAAAKLRERKLECEFVLMGFSGAENPTAIPDATLDRWVSAGLVTYVPAEPDVRPQIALADCVVLPSYREGTPRSLLEAASMGKPIITTDVPGCRQVVEDGVTGYLAEVRDAGDLARKMERMMRLPADARAEMGRRGRQKMVAYFEESIVIDEYVRAVNEVTAR